MTIPPELTLSVLGDAAGHDPVPVLSLSWGEVRAAFPAGRAPVLLIGQSVELGFRGPALDGLARVRGFVALRADEPRQRIYEFQLDHADGTALDAAVNRRTFPRAAPDPRAPIRVALRAPGTDAPVHALLRDVSEGGASVLLGREQEWLLARAERVSLELRLPGSSELVALEGRIVHRRLERTAIHYGIAFDEAATEADGPARLRIRAFVAARQEAVRARMSPGTEAA